MFFEPGQHKVMGLPHNPFKALIAPRPIGWITTLGPEGVVNLAPYSFFNGLADAPPMMFFAPNGPARALGVKDSQRNAEESGEFVANLATWSLRDQMNASSASLSRDRSELAESGLHTAPSRLVKTPRVAESPAALECRYLQTVDLPSDDPERGNFLVIGQVVGIHIDDTLINDKGLVEIARARPLARLGYMDYTAVDEVFSMRRPG